MGGGVGLGDGTLYIRLMLFDFRDVADVFDVLSYRGSGGVLARIGVDRLV